MSGITFVFHLCKRFFGSLNPFPLSADDVAWVAQVLNKEEFALWKSMQIADRRHSIVVARAVSLSLDNSAAREVLAAAIMHDCGKVASRLNPVSRVFATFFWLCVDDRKSSQWLEKEGAGIKYSLLHKLALYRQHPKIGAELLRTAGAHPITTAWAQEHHLPSNAWTVPQDIGQVLKDCDDD